MSDLAAGWHCPQCGQALRHDASHLLCETHGKMGMLDQGLLVFGTPGPYWGELEQEEMQALCGDAERRGWPTALAELATTQPALLRYATDERRTNWLGVYPGRAGGTALDIGAGWGQISAGLTAWFDTVYALESVAERARLLTARFRGNAKVRVAVAAFPEAPLAPGSLDLAVMNGVLEWLAVGRSEANPTEAQLACLRRAYDLLRPGGWLYVGIENRFGHHLVAGGNDHSGRPYTSIVPRWLAHRMCRAGGYRTAQEGYRTYTYSYWGYRRLLRRAGFEAVTVYAPLPGYNQPEAMIPLHRVQPFDHYLASFAAPSRKVTAARRVPGGPLRLALARLLAGHFSIFARKGEG